MPMATKLKVPSSTLGAPVPRLTAPPKAVDPFYRSPGWLALIASIKRERGNRCQDCPAQGGVIIGDHIHELKDGGAPLDRRNVRLRCVPCHNTKTAASRAIRAGRVSKNPGGGGSKDSAS
jgi:5-methylcytosine-specific restriction protein A